MYALKAATGELIWKTRPVEHLLAESTATPQFYKGVIYQGFSSIEESLVVDPNAACCSFRGSVVAIEADTGSRIWQSFTIQQPAKPTGKGKQLGPSGAGIWSTPTIDEQKGVLYVATGDNYSNPVTETSDAVLALDLKTGKLLWSRQLMQGDAYNSACSSREPANCPDKNGPDFDFGQPPILSNLGGGKRAPHFAHGLGEMMGAAVRQIVAIDAGDHHEAQFHLRGHFRDMARLFGVERKFLLDGRAFGNGTETTAARTQISEDHESRGAAVKAFVHVRAAGRFTHGV